MGSHYGTLVEAAAYFEERLHTESWDDSNTTDRTKALYEATRIIDALNFKGYRASVYIILDANPDATDAEIRAAELDQDLEFPRDEDAEVPTAIKQAAFEIAYALLDGRDPEQDFENLAATGQRYGASVSTSYDRQQAPQLHIANGVPSLRAWHLLQPFLRDSNEVRLDRVT